MSLCENRLRGGDRRVAGVTARRVMMCTTAVVALVSSQSLWAMSAAAASSSPLVSALQRDPVQSINVPRASFAALSAKQMRSLRVEIRRLDPGRVWILIVSRRGQESLNSFADPIFGDLPAGTLIAVADDPEKRTLTHFWVGSSWEPSDAAQAQLNDVIQGFHKGQGSLFDDLRVAIQSFAHGDASVGHPGLNSGGGEGGAAGSGGGGVGAASPGAGASGQGGAGNAGLITWVIIAAVFLAVGVVVGGRYVRGALRASHWRREEAADAREQAQADFVKLGDQIGALDIDSEMANANPAAKDRYAKALDCYQEAERRLRQPDDEYQFEHAVEAIKRGLEYLREADSLFNPTRESRPVQAEQQQ
jgi:hypothetical protein